MTEKVISTLADSTNKLGNYDIVRVLAKGISFHCMIDESRQVVLKRLDDDCILGSQLHPSIKERLARVRELAQRQVATLQTVEKIEGNAYLVWDFIAGETLDEHVSFTSLSVDRFLSIARETALAVDSLHSLGIVHGSIHSRNIIIGQDGSLWLTHVSPYLYSDPAEDVRRTLELLRSIISSHGIQDSPAGKWLLSAEAEQCSLRLLASRLANLSDAAHVDKSDFPISPATAVRKGSLFAAVALTIAILIAVAVYIAFVNHADKPQGQVDSLDEPISTK